MKRVKRSHGPLSKTPENGEKITVVRHDTVEHFIHARIRNYSGGRHIHYIGIYAELSPPERRRTSGSVMRRDEGLTWARGWDTPVANALRTMAALS